MSYNFLVLYSKAEITIEIVITNNPRGIVLDFEGEVFCNSKCILILYPVLFALYVLAYVMYVAGKVSR
jgi:hypothetical protein